MKSTYRDEKNWTDSGLHPRRTFNHRLASKTVNQAAIPQKE
jgi:hypothetical protein